jgi:hypothetical protein
MLIKVKALYRLPGVFSSDSRERRNKKRREDEASEFRNITGARGNLFAMRVTPSHTEIIKALMVNVKAPKFRVPGLRGNWPREFEYKWPNPLAIL